MPDEKISMSMANDDIIEHILDSYDHWWPCDFCRLALVSPAWLQAVRKRLYAYPALTSYQSCHNLARTLETNPDYISLVRGLDLRPSITVNFFRRKEHTAGSCPGVPRLLALTRLERLTLGGDLAVYAERFLRAVASPHTVKSLNIVSSDSCESRVVRYTPVTWDGELALRFYSLESLSLDGALAFEIHDSYYDSKAGIDSDGVDVPSHGCKLRELHLRGLDIIESPIYALLHSPASWEHLRSLTFSLHTCMQLEVQGFAALLKLTHRSLEHLVFHCCTSSKLSEALVEDLLEYMHDVPPLRSLRSLETTHELMHEAFRPIIANVETLDVLGGFTASQLSGWAAYIEECGFPRLRKLHLRLDESPTRRLPQTHDAFTGLADACKLRKVEFDSSCG